MVTQFIDCILETGFFEDELYVLVGDSSAIVSRDDVEIASEPQGSKDGKGRVCVSVIQKDADRWLVELPGQPVVGSLRTWISDSQVRSMAVEA